MIDTRQLFPQGSRWLYYAVIATLGVMTLYLCLRLTMVAITFDAPAAAIAAVILLMAELFVGLNGVAYFANVAKVAHYGQRSAGVFRAHTCAPVAVLVTSFNESVEVLEETIASVRAMDYPAIHLYLVDDSTRDAGREAAAHLARKYGGQLIHRSNRAGYKAGAINDLLPRLTEPFVAVLDADQRPASSWLKETVPLLEEQPRLSLVQAPQVYVNTEGLRVAQAAAHQQAIFFEYICEGKAISNAMFCCGSNVVIRREALLSIGVDVNGRRHYFDETSVTEDFATTVRLHMHGWDTAYINETYVVGMGPETLSAYFTQQMRWAMGTLGVGLRVLGMLLRHPRRLKPVQWWEYIVSGTYYFIGFVNLIFMAAPIAYILGGFSPASSGSDLYLWLFVPYFVLSMSSFFVGLRLRGYSVLHLWLATALSFATFWIYVKAGLVALFGLKRAFGVTPKAVGGSIPTSKLLPELTVFVLTTSAAVVGILHLAIVGVEASYVVTTIWAAYHGVLLSTLFVYFNRPVTIAEPAPIFERLVLT